MATMRDVAARAGVSPKTVSRVVNDDPHVTPGTKERVEAALRELSYVPNPIATAFRAGRAPVVGVAVPDIVDPFFAAITKAAGTVAAGRGMSILIASLGDAAEREGEIVAALLRQSLSGLVIAPTSHDHAYLQPWAERLPLVFVDRAPVGVRADSFTEDDVGGAFRATAHLLDHGHRRIAFVGDDRSITTTANRLVGHHEALTGARIGNDDRLVAMLGAPDRERAAAALGGFDRLAVPPTALFCSNAQVATSFVPLLRGRELAILSFGDFPLADVLSPTFTVVDQAPERLGALAVQRVLDRLDHPERRYRRRTVLPVELIERESSRVAVPLACSAGAQQQNPRHG